MGCRAIVGLSFSLLVPLGCAAISVASLEGAQGDAAAQVPAAAADAGVILAADDAGFSGETTVVTAGYRAACGDVRACNPDDRLVCAPYVPTGVSPEGGAATDAGGLGSDAGSSIADAYDVGDSAAAGDAGPARGGSPLACRMFDDGHGARCVPAGPAAVAGGCFASEDCGAGLVCVKYTCVPTCCARSTRCAPGTACMHAAPMGTRGKVPMWVPVCGRVTECSFVGASPCSRDEQCGFSEDEGIRTCIALGSATEDASCESLPCGAGLVCVGSNLQRQCARLCAPGGSAGCTGAQRCRVHPALLGTSSVGYCAQ